MGALAFARAGMATARVAGYYQGGATGGAGVPAPRPAAGMAATGQHGAAPSQPVQVLTSRGQRLAKVQEWPTQLNAAPDLARKQAKIKQVPSRSEIRPKGYVKKRTA